MRKTLTSGLLAIAMLAAPGPVAANGGPVVNVPTIWIYPYMNRNEMDSKWVPRTYFWISGQVGDGSVFWVKFNAPGAKKPWFTVECNHQWSGPIGKVACDSVDQFTPSGAVGPVDFTIGMKNELEGKNLELFKGTFKAGKHHVGNDHPNFKKNFGYYVDYDWALPFAYLTKFGEDDTTPAYMMAHVWFRERYDEQNRISLYVYHAGKQICKSEDQSQGTPSYVTKSPFKPSHYGWFQTSFHLVNCRIFKEGLPESVTYPDATWLNKNPGEYEIKVLRNGKLTRTGKFTIGADGQIVEIPGTLGALGTPAVVVPMHVNDDQAGKWNQNAWQKDAFYGHPLPGFSVSK